MKNIHHKNALNKQLWAHLKQMKKIYSRKAMEDIKKNQMGSLELQEK